MKLHQLVVSGNQQGSYPQGVTYKDFNITASPFNFMVMKNLGQGKPFLNIKKLNIELYSSSGASSQLLNLPDGKGFISTMQQDGFDFENYFLLSSVDKVIRLAEVTKDILQRINPNAEETNPLLTLLDSIIDKAPQNIKWIEDYSSGIQKMINETPCNSNK